MTLREVYDKVNRLSHEERLNLAIGSGNEIATFLQKNGFDGEKSLRFFLYITALFAGADGVLDEDEYRLFIDAFKVDLTYERLNELLKGGFSDEYVRKMDETIDRFPQELKFAICNYGLAFISADGEITEKEQKVFERILA
ncbi:MAG: hypothetical protein IJQ67_01285 [Bacilli bacterium]|nr:hypothetical protein [Bacilli bacterium]